MNFHEQNKRAWDRMARQGHRFSKPASDAEFANPLSTVDPAGWYGGSIRAWNVLCLAAGGGRQGPLYAAAGARVTVVDVSAEQLAIDRQVAAERHLELITVQTSMEELEMFRADQFDLVIQPVSTCYIRQLQGMFAQLQRIVRPSGLYVSQHKTPQNLQTSLAPGTGGAYELERPHDNTSPSAEHAPSRLRETGTIEYLHSFGAILGGLCSAGFAIEGYVEPVHARPNDPPGSFGHRCHYVPPYLRIKARRISGQAPAPIAPQAV